MGALSRWAVRRPWLAIGAWLVLTVIIGLMGTRFAGTLNDSFSLPDTDSLKAQQLLEKMPKSQSSGATTSSATIVWSPQTDGAKAVDAATAATVVPLLTHISTLPAKPSFWAWDDTSWYSRCDADFDDLDSDANKSSTA